MKPYLETGSYNVTCDVCGLRYKADDLTRRWDGLMVCSKDLESRHPSDFVRGVPEKPYQVLGGIPPTRIFFTNYLLTEDGDTLLAEDGEQLEWR